MEQADEETAMTETALLRRLEALEKHIFGSKAPDAAPGVRDLSTKVRALESGLERAEVGRHDLREIAKKVTTTGVGTPAAGSSWGGKESVELKENLILAAADEIQHTAKQLADIEAMQEHINPSYMKDIPQLSERLARIENGHLGESATMAQILEDMEQLVLTYSEVVSVLSEKFVLWDDALTSWEEGTSAGS